MYNKNNEKIGTLEINNEGGQKWFNCDGEVHRLNDPAVIYSSGYQEYCINGKLHRVDGPACCHKTK